MLFSCHNGKHHREYKLRSILQELSGNLNGFLFKFQIALKHLQDDVREVRSGFECGVAIKGFDAFEEGDVLESYTIELVEAA